MSVERVDAVVIGAGVVGLAVARALSMAGREVMVLEAASAIGTETSSRNSEVVHAGIYYPPGSLKARLCVSGRQKLYDYCAERGIKAKAVGKLIVATSASQVETLAALKATAVANGVHDLELIDAKQAQRMQPALSCVAALLSPSSGIVDSHAYMLALQGDIENAGGMVIFNAPVDGGAVSQNGIRLEVGGDHPIAIEAATVVNAAGLQAPQVALEIEGLPGAHVPQAWLAKGNYFALTGVRAPFSQLIYPVPEPGGLGIHATIDLGGQIRFGPDVEWVDRIDYAVDPARGERFYDSIRRYWPDLPDGALTPTYSGIRPKISGPGEAAADFVIQGPAQHGVPGLVNLFGIESPGLTSSLAIADMVAAALDANVAALA
jgi:L-2-hydroxyglutarate oxidase LhgO